MEIDTSKVLDKIKSEFDDPNEYDELVEAWGELCEQAQKNSNDDLQFAEIEKAAIVALSTAPTEQPTGNVGHGISQMLNSFDYPTYLVTSDGFVAAGNLSAWKEFSLEPNNSIDQLPVKIEGIESISQLIKRETRKLCNDLEPTVLLKRTYTDSNNPDATIAIVVSSGQVRTALVFVITTKWKPRSVRLLEKQFGLSKAEAAILISFVDGFSSQDIAQQRNRSHETVRAQFQSIREKLGARNQMDLLRTTLSVSEFSKDIGRIASTVEHPHRRKSENIMPGGRVVEATLMGDFSGDPIVTIAAVSHYTFNAEFEKRLFNAKLFVISVCPPGFGKTDPISKDSLWIQQASDDVLAVLDQLGISRCALLIKYTNAPMSYRIAGLNPERFSHIVQLSTCGPAVYDKPSDARSTWMSGVIKACMNNSAIAGVLVRGMVKSMVAVGAKQFMRLQMSSNPIDAKYALLPENIVESQHALDTATQHGLNAALQEHVLVFQDWTSDVRAVQVDMTFIHGSENKLFTIDSVRSLAAVVPAKVKLIVIKGAGFTLVQSHPQEVIEILRSVVDSCAVSRDRQSTSKSIEEAIV